MQKLISQIIKNKFQNKSILILGMGREGLSTYKFLKTYLPQQKIDIADEKLLEELNPEVQKLFNNNKNDTFSHIKNLKSFASNELADFDFIFVSPGISPKKYTFLKGKNISSNTQLFFELAKKLKIKTIGVTGTKGKSTTTALIHHVLKENNFNSFLGGNIGTPTLDLINQIQNSKFKNNKIFIVLELSSHQLANLKTSPDIAVIQTIVPEHLDYYKNFEQYVAAKANITKYQSEKDLLIYFDQNKIAKQIALKSKAEKIGFSKNKLINLADTKLKGQHNLINMMPSIIIGKKFGLNNEQIKNAIKTFKGLEHRLEFVTNIKGADYYNDSLATNPHATIAALDAFKNKKIILIAGGYDRGLNYQKLAEKITNSKIKNLILFPDTDKKILKFLKKWAKSKDATARVSSMTEAVQTAYKAAKDGDVVLLSPASASFNMFKDYADRGEQFKEAVLKLA